VCLAKDAIGNFILKGGDWPDYLGDHKTLEESYMKAADVPRDYLPSGLPEVITADDTSRMYE
jgi:hypothetical protein